jgi:hypothetical protein
VPNPIYDRYPKKGRLKKNQTHNIEENKQIQLRVSLHLYFINRPIVFPSGATSEKYSQIRSLGGLMLPGWEIVAKLEYQWDWNVFFSFLP